ncbi:MAG: metal-dependent transcriptional regulator [Planctomycetota bacterium]|jgi:DtxR family Mn-dependent transcriptional regulator
MKKSEALTASLEDYLEAIWHLVKDKQVARSKDIADRLGVNKSSVTGALKSLSSRGLVRYEAYQYATLTGEGKKAAAEIVRRHEIIRDFLHDILQLEAEVAEENACRIEHALGPEAMEKLVQFVDFVQTCPRTASDWSEKFKDECKAGPDKSRCRDCLSTCLEDFKASFPGGPTGQGKSERLSDLGTGEKGRITGFTSVKTLPDSLRGKGLVTGALVEVEGVDSEEEVVRVKVRGYHLILRKTHADSITVRIVT